MRQEFQFKRIPKHQASTMQIAEYYFYEAKPLLYLVFSLLVLNAYKSFDLWVKYTALGIVLFSAYVIYSRLTHRGYIK